MNNNIDLTEILKDCKEGTKLYCTLLGEVEFVCIEDDISLTQIVVRDKYTDEYKFTREGKYYNVEDGECLLFPSKEQRDWSKFINPWYKKEKFDPNTLKPFNRVIVIDYPSQHWCVGLFSYYIKSDTYPCKCVGSHYKYCIPYNDETKHLVGTTDEAPEYYRYWEE